MVLVKVNDGSETRKLQISSDTKYGELKEEVRKLFPSLAGGVEFSLQYQDEDGDIIALSTDGELGTALAHLPEDTVWRLQAVPQRSRPETHSLPHPSSWHPFGQRYVVPRRPARHHHHYLDPFQALFEAPSRVDPFFSPRTDWSSLWKEMDDEMQEMRKMHDDHMMQFEEQRKKVEEKMQKNMERKQSVPTSVPTGATGDTTVAEGGKPTWHMQQFGSWEPQTFGSPYGQRTVVGPVGYHMYWGYSDPHQSEESKEKSGQQMETSESGEQPKEKDAK